MNLFKGLLCWIAIALPVTAGLVFENRVVDVSVGPDVESFEVLFPFQVMGGDVEIKSFDAPCSCLEAEISDGGRLVWKDGEKGIVKGIFELGSIKGKIEKFILLKVAGQPNDIKLTARVDIPELVKLEPPTLAWEVGGKPDSKTLRVTIQHDKPVRLIEATVSNPNFEIEKKTITEGREYELVVTPKKLGGRSLAMIRLRTDSEYKRHQRYQAFAMVKPPGR